MFSRPTSETLKAGNLRQRVSRCQVCQRTSRAGAGVVAVPDVPEYEEEYNNTGSAYAGGDYGDYALSL